jgi:hypothetical protein
MISRSKRERETEAEAIVPQLDSSDDLQVNGDRLAGTDVANGQIDDPVPVLACQSG